MSIISQETWDKFTEEEKDNIRNFCCNVDDGSLAGYTAANAVRNIFGKENLQPKSKIKTWEDVEKECGDIIEVCRTDDDFYSLAFSAIHFNNKLGNKLIATLKIAKLIELGYGGMVTEEEWKNDTFDKYSIEWDEEDNCPTIRRHCSRDWADFISFHTLQQAEEFMSHPENRALVEQYYMIGKTRESGISHK